MALPVPDLLETLLESAARTGRHRHGSHPSPGERRPDDAGDGAEEILAKAGARFLEPSAVAVTDPAAKVFAVAVDSIPEPPARADLPSPPVSVLREPALSQRAADSAFDAPLDGELLADLVNEALIEQARRNGVDLS